MKELRKRLPEKKVFLWIFGALLVAGLMFHLGLTVGYTKANFSYQWGENYHRNFGGPRGGFMHMPGNNDFVKGHGVFGKILTISGETLTISDQRNTEISVLVTDTTVLKRFQATITLMDLKADDIVVIIGEPNTSGQIQAKFIRVMPARQSGKTLLPKKLPRQFDWGHL